MDYYIRIFSTGQDAPTPADIAAAAKRAGCAPACIQGAEPLDGAWRDVELEYGGDRCPLRLERRLAETPGDFAEVARFRALIGKPGRSKKKQQVLEALGSSRQMIAFRVPLHVLENDDWQLVHSLLRFLQPFVNGLIQVDGEGFYNGDGMLLELAE